MTVDNSGTIQLQVLGPARVQRAGGQLTGSLLTQPRRLAVLAYLTLARPRGLHARDTVVAMLWPESDDGSGRHALRNALHAIRSTLGDSVITTAGDGLVGIEPARVVCDAIQLETLAAAGDWAGAVSAYHGELLQGFHVSDAPEFERWLDAERLRLRELVGSAAWSWADECQRLGDMDGALQAGRRAVDLAPDDELAVRRLLDLAKLGGDRATALRAYGRFADRLATEFEAEPSRETQRLVRALREAMPPGSPDSAGFTHPAMERPAETTAQRVVAGEARVRPRPKSPRRAVLGGLVVAGVAALAIIVASPALAPPTVARFAVGAATPVTTDDGLEIQPEISPDGKLVAYAAGTSLRMRVFVRPLGTTRSIALSDDSTRSGSAPRWSPDGSQILYLADGGVRVSPALGGDSRVIVSGGRADSVLSAAWSPRGDEIAFSRRDSVFRRRLDDGIDRLVGVVKEPHSCVWSPVRPLIACVSGNRVYLQPASLFANRAPSRIVLFPDGGGDAREVPGEAALYQSPTWSRAGSTLYFLSDVQGTRDIYAIAIDSGGRALAAPSRLTTGLGALTIALAADGRRLTYATYAERANIWSMPVPGRGPVSASAATAVTSGAQVVEAMRATRDGRFLIYDSNISGRSQIYRRQLPDGPTEPLTSDARDKFRGDLSPDGREIAYQAFVANQRDLFVMREGDPRPRAIASSAEMEVAPLWAPDGRSLAYSILAADTSHVYVMTRDSAGTWSAPVGVGFGGPHGVDWSPDSRRLALVPERGDRAVRIIDVATKRETVIYSPRNGTTDPVFEHLVWVPDGQTLYLKSHDAAGHTMLWSMPAAGGRPRPLVRFDDLARPSYRPDFATDGRRFYFAIQDRQSDVWVADVTRSR